MRAGEVLGLQERTELEDRFISVLPEKHMVTMENPGRKDISARGFLR